MRLKPDEEVAAEYFQFLADRDVYRAPTVLSWLTDYIDTHNEQEVCNLLTNNNGQEAMSGLVDLLEFDDKRLTQSVVHILGTIVEHPSCRKYVLQVPRNTASNGQNNPTLFTALVNMLMSEDKNVVMNAAGTIANIADSEDGRTWILQQAAFQDALPILGVLTVDNHQWAASNSALVIARLCLSSEGIMKMLSHERSNYILTNLCVSLCGSSPGSSMNAAFAIGRLLEREDARTKLLSMKNFSNTMTALTKMLHSDETGPRKNACFAFSCLANSQEGHKRLLENLNSEVILGQLVKLLTDEDNEAAWFAAVTLRSLCNQKEGVFRLRDHVQVQASLKKLIKAAPTSLKQDLLTELKLAYTVINKLPKLQPPVLSAKSASSVSAHWEAVVATTGTKIIYQLFQGTTCVYEGKSTSTVIKNLKSYTTYVFRVRATSGSDEGPYSGGALVSTQQGVPGPPVEATSEGKPQHNSIRINWRSPDAPNGIITGYHIYVNGERVGVVGADRLSFTAKDLPHSTSVKVQIAAVTSAGEGEKSPPILCSTLNLSDYPPKKPILSTSGGANEINISWIDPPKQLGIIDHYELVMDGEVIYSGKDQGYRVSNLEPLQEYTFNIRVVTADGYIVESEPAKKKAGSKVVKKGVAGAEGSEEGDEEGDGSGGGGGTEGDSDRPKTESNPEKNVSGKDEREIIRPKKKFSRFNENRDNDTRNKTKPFHSSQTSKLKDTSNVAANFQKPKQKETDTVTPNVSGTDISVTISPPSTTGTCEPSVVSDVVVVTRQPIQNSSSEQITSTFSASTSTSPNTSSFALRIPGASPISTDSSPTAGDPRVIALKQLTQYQPEAGHKGPGKSVRFDDTVTYDETVTCNDTEYNYVPNVVTARVESFDPKAVENISDTSIELNNKSKSKSVDFLVNYVTTYEQSSSGNPLDYTFRQPPNDMNNIDEGVIAARAQLVSPAADNTEYYIQKVDPTNDPAVDATGNQRKLSSARFTAPQNTPASTIDTCAPGESRYTAADNDGVSVRDNRGNGEDLHSKSSLSDVTLQEHDRVTMPGRDDAERIHYSRPKYKHPPSFDFTELRDDGEGINEQNRLINALLSQRAENLKTENLRTHELIDSVRKNIRDTINSKKNDSFEANVIKQISSGKNDNFAYNSQGTKQEVKLSSVDMSIFGDLGRQHRVSRAVHYQSNVKKVKHTKSKKSVKQKLPPLRSGGEPLVLAFHRPL